MDLEKFGTAGDLQELLTVREEIEGLFSRQNHDPMKPRADLLDAGDAYRVVVEVPGVAQDDLEIALQGRALTVAGLREPAFHDAEPVFSERPGGHFQRTIELPAEVDRETASAHLEHGLLIVTLPKR